MSKVSWEDVRQETDTVIKNFKTLENYIYELCDYIDVLKAAIDNLGYTVEKTPEGYQCHKIDG